MKKGNRIIKNVYETILEYINKVGLLKFITLITLFTFAAIRIIANYLPDIFSDFTDSGLYESLVMIALMEILASVLDRSNESKPQIFTESKADKKLREILDLKNIDEILINSTDIGCRTSTIPFILNEYNIPIKVFHNSFSKDPQNYSFLTRNIELIKKSVNDKDRLKLLELIPTNSMKTIRAIILSDINANQFYCFVSWYIYKQNSIESTQNPIIFLTIKSTREQFFMKWISEKIAE